MTIKQILCPIDFSECSRHAADHALATARWYGASVTALHVIPPVSSSIPPVGHSLYPPFVFTPDDLKQFRTELDAFVRAGGQADVPLESVVIEGGVAGEIGRLAKELPADLLVMGTHGRTGFDRLLLGSIAEKMLRKAPCPLLTVPLRSPEAVPNPPLFRRIVCGIDFSPSSLRALAWAESFAEEADAELTVLHVLEPAPVAEPVVIGGPGAPPYDPDASTNARRRLAQVVSEDARTYSHVLEVVIPGKPYREIVRHAAEHRADLIVLGAHGGPLGALAWGSTANHVVRQAACPVLTIHAR